jgi:hypothetical protein
MGVLAFKLPWALSCIPYIPLPNVRCLPTAYPMALSADAQRAAPFLLGSVPKAPFLSAHSAITNKTALRRT